MMDNDVDRAKNPLKWVKKQVKKLKAAFGKYSEFKQLNFLQHSYHRDGFMVSN